MIQDSLANRVRNDYVSTWGWLKPMLMALLPCMLFLNVHSSAYASPETSQPDPEVKNWLNTVQTQLMLPVLSSESLKHLETGFRKMEPTESILSVTESVLALSAAIEKTMLLEYHIAPEHSRWFTTGVAIVLAADCLNHDLQHLPGTFAPYWQDRAIHRIHLASWIREEPDTHLNAVRTAYAIHEVHRWVSENGIEVIPRLFNDLKRRGTPVPSTEPGRLPQRHRTIQDIYQAVQSVTGINMPQRMLRYSLHWSEVNPAEESTP